MRKTTNSATQIAKALLCIAKDENIKLDHLKLQKLLYFAQAISLVRNNKPIFKDQIQAWKHGPVVEPVYSTYKKYGKKYISCAEKDKSTIKLSIEDIKVLEDTLETFKEYEGVELKDMTHKHLPWNESFEENKNNEIENKVIKKYYTQILE